MWIQRLFSKLPPIHNSCFEFPYVKKSLIGCPWHFTKISYIHLINVPQTHVAEIKLISQILYNHYLPKFSELKNQMPKLKF
jgi:hypothetical protein